MCTDVCNKCAVCVRVCVVGVIVRSTTAISPVGRWRTVCVDKDKGIKSWWHPDDKHPPAARSYLSPRSCTFSWHDINNHLVLFLPRTTWRLQGGALCDHRCDVVNKFAAITASEPQLCVRTHASLTLQPVGLPKCFRLIPACRHAGKNILKVQGWSMLLLLLVLF